MNRYKLIIFFTFISASLYIRSQTITGVVLNKADKMPLSGVIVQLLNSEEKIVSYTQSKDNGAFSLRYSDSGGEKTLLFKSLGYGIYRLSASKIALPLEIMLEAEPVQLRDIAVIAPNILKKGDTLVYDVKKYADVQDRTIADVLKKMPGVEVVENGQIKYNGKPINKFYIEGSDFLEGRYGIATNNISHKDVRSVEIMENHQPVRVLQDIEYSEQAGLNIRLQENAKLRWIGIVNGSTGFSPFLYDASLFAMRISGKLQNMETAKTDNTGWNPASQSAVHTFDNLFGTALQEGWLPDFITINSSAIPLADKRTRFNQSDFINTTNAMKLSNAYEVKTNITYESDKLDSEHNLRIDYLNPSISPFIEKESLQTGSHKVSGQFILQSNTVSRFLKNNLSANFRQDNASSEINGTSRYGQNAEKPVSEISNDLQLTKRIKNRIFTITSSNRMIRKPHTLFVDDGTDKNYYQKVTTFAFLSATETGYGWIFGRWQVKSRAGLHYNYNKLTSELTNINFDSYPSGNDSRLNSMRIYLRPEIIYENGRLWLNPHILANYYNYRFNDRKDDSYLIKKDVIFSPAFSARYKLTAQWDIYADMKYAATAPDKKVFYNGLIMNSYRYVSVGYPLLNTGAERSLHMSFRYRNPVASLFANLTSGYEKNSVPFTVNQIFAENKIIYAYYPASNRSNIFRLDGGVSKGIVSGRVYAGTDAGYIRLETAAMRNSVIIPCRSNVITLKPKIKGTLSKWLNVDYTLFCMLNRLNIGNSDVNSAYSNLNQTLNATVIPKKNLQIYITGEHYNTLFDDTANHLFLLDAGMKWLISEKLDIHLSASNLLNQQEYAGSRYETLSETVYHYKIRPRNIMVSLQLKI